MWVRAITFSELGLVVAGGVDGDLGEDLSGGGVDGAGPEVLDEDFDVGSCVGSYDGKAAELAGDSQGDGADAVRAPEALTTGADSPRGSQTVRAGNAYASARKAHHLALQGVRQTCEDGSLNTFPASGDPVLGVGEARRRSGGLWRLSGDAWNPRRIENFVSVALGKTHGRYLDPAPPSREPAPGANVS